MSRKHIYFPWSPGQLLDLSTHGPSFYLGLILHGIITLISCTSHCCLLSQHLSLLLRYTTIKMNSLAPRNRLRKNDSKPLHSRWGDVSISTPTEGSWSQYNNPRTSAQRHEGYGPGYVPEDAPRVLSRPKQHRNKSNYHTYGGYQVEGSSSSTSLSSSRSTSPSSFAGKGKGKGALNPRRLSMRLGLTKDADGADRQPPANIEPEFAYKPIKYDYSSDMASRSASRFHYIASTSPRHFNEAESRDRPRYVPGSNSSNDYLHSYPVDGRGSPQYQRKGSADKSRSHTKRLTMVMVPDAEDMYG